MESPVPLLVALGEAVRYLFDRCETYSLDSLHAVSVERKRVPDRQPPKQLHEGLRADFWHAIEEQDLPVGPSRIVQSLDVERLLVLRRIVNYCSIMS